MQVFLVLILNVPLSGCSSLISGALSGMAEILTAAILNNPDIETVEDGLPSYLLMVDALAAAAPKSASLTLSAADLYGSFAGGFVDDVERAKVLTEKSLNYGFAAICNKTKTACGLRELPFEDFGIWVAEQPERHIQFMYSLAVVWAGWIQAHSGDYNAIAELSRVKLLMGRVLEVDENLDYGGPHLYFGVFETLLPPAYGGKPELGREHFEKAIEISKGRYLMAKVLYAKQYARLVYNRELHDRLLNEVLDADPVAEDITVVNVVAQRRAKILLAEADDYF